MKYKLTNLLRRLANYKDYMLQFVNTIDAPYYK